MPPKFQEYVPQINGDNDAAWLIIRHVFMDGVKQELTSDGRNESIIGELVRTALDL